MAILSEFETFGLKGIEFGSTQECVCTLTKENYSLTVFYQYNEYKFTKPTAGFEI